MIEIVESASATGYTLLPATGGAGRSGRWSEHQVTMADSKMLHVTIAKAGKG